MIYSLSQGEKKSLFIIIGITLYFLDGVWKYNIGNFRQNVVKYTYKIYIHNIIYYTLKYLFLIELYFKR